MQTSAQLRSLFVTILAFGVPGDPRMLWDKYKEHPLDMLWIPVTFGHGEVPRFFKPGSCFSFL